MQENPPDDEVVSWLKTLGVGSLCQWDVLIFLHRHQTSLFGADHLARLLGYATEQIVAALDALGALGLVERSRVSQGARLYHLNSPSAPPRGKALEQLFALAGDRAGRLRLSKLLRQSGRLPQAGPEAARRFPEEAQQVVRAKTQRPRHREKRRGPCRKAI
jgi:hypothetical protein